MPDQFSPEVARLVEQHMATGLYASEDALLCEALQALSDDEADLAAIREAIAEVAAGDPGIPLDEAIRAIRGELPPPGSK